jgi:hypothetical protein
MDRDLQQAAVTGIVLLLALVLPLDAIGRVLARWMDRLHGIEDDGRRED